MGLRSRETVTVDGHTMTMHALAENRESEDDVLDDIHWATTWNVYDDATGQMLGSLVRRRTTDRWQHTVRSVSWRLAGEVEWFVKREDALRALRAAYVPPKPKPDPRPQNTYQATVTVVNQKGAVVGRYDGRRHQTPSLQFAANAGEAALSALSEWADYNGQQLPGTGISGVGHEDTAVSATVSVVLSFSRIIIATATLDANQSDTK